MIVRSSSLNLQSAYLRESVQTTEVTARTWGGRARPAPAAAPPVMRPAGRDGPGSPRADGAGRADGPVAGRLASLIALVERLTGEKVHVLDPRELHGDHRPADHAARAAGSAAGHGGEVTVTSAIVEREVATVAIEGHVTTADGHEIDVAVDLELYRETARSTRVQAQFGAPEPKDPLVLSFGVTPVLTPHRVELDLDGDGTADALPFVADGLAYLALDRDGDGRVSDGTELFGPATGDGFAELAGYDADGNGWIDEADPVFGRLRLWSAPDAPLQTLAERGVGAVGLAAVASPYRLQDGGELLGELRSTGLWLGEDGSAGTVHQVDVIS